jgi:hypothetical protein
MLLRFALLALVPALVTAHYTNEWAIQIDGDEAEAERVAKELNCKVTGKKVGEQTSGKFFKITPISFCSQNIPRHLPFGAPSHCQAFR